MMEENKKIHTGPSNMNQEGSRANFQPPSAYIPACQAASSAYPTNDVPQRPGSVPTRSKTEAL